MLENLFALGHLAVSREEYQEAINIYKEILSKDPNNIQALIALGDVFYLAGDLPASLWAFNRALKISREEFIIKKIQKVEEELNQKKRSELKYKSEFLVEGSYIYRIKDKRRERFLIRGINIGLGLPGYFPGEYPIKKATYLRWFNLIEEMGLNCIRVYTLHPPGFYEALYEFNKEKPRLYLIQGIWYEPPPDHNLEDPKFISAVKEHCREVIDAVHGNITLPERPGLPAGRYLFDVSGCLLGYLFGREPEVCLVKDFNRSKNYETSSFLGNYIRVIRGSPFEIWNAKILDWIVSYSINRYGKLPLVSVVNWPTLDPLSHPSESRIEDEIRFFWGEKIREGTCLENEDDETFDTSKFESQVKNFFASYHIYPNYPDFMNYSFLNEENPYESYLLSLKKYYKNKALLVAEFGISTSRVSAHWHVKGWTHGGLNSKMQGELIVEMMKSIEKSEYAGYLIFSLFDEWFKSTWLFNSFYIPRENKPKWFNFQDPEENYGILEVYPGYPEKKITLSGNYKEWEDAEVIYRKEEVREGDILKEIRMTHDEGFLYIGILTYKNLDFHQMRILVGVDTGYEEVGEYLIIPELDLRSPIGLKYIIQISSINDSHIMVQGSYNKYIKTLFMSKYDNVYPEKSEDGCWNRIFVLTNRRRVSKDFKRIFGPKVCEISRLKFGSLDENNKNYDSLADFYFTDSLLELRLPWELLNFSDPSSNKLLWQDRVNRTKVSDGIRIIAICCSKKNINLGSKIEVIDTLPKPLTRKFIKTYKVRPWNYPLFHIRPKKSFFIIKNFLRNRNG